MRKFFFVPLSRARSASEFALVFSLLVFSGCFRPAFHPEGASVPLVRAAAVCEKLNSQRIGVTSLRALVDATVTRGNEQGSFRYALISDEPAKFRLDVLPPAGSGAYTLGLLVSDGGNVIWLDPQEKRFVRGSNEQDLIARHLGLHGVSRQVAIALMTGMVPPIDCAGATIFDLKDGDTLVVDNGAKVAWYLEGKTPQIKAAKFLDEGGSSCAMEVSLSGDSGGEARRLGLQIFSPASARVDLVVTRLIINPRLKPELFAVTPPRDYTSAD